MSEIPSFIIDLALILIVAAIVSLVFKMLKQPVVLGYIVAGILAGRGGSFFPTVSNSESIHIWAEIGIIFLLFTLGLEFSFKKLAKVGGTAVTSAVTIVLGMMTIGFFTGHLLGWDDMNCLFLGGMLSMSSTTIIFKAFEDMNMRNKQFAGVVFGILIVEDLFAVLLMVLLSTLAASKHFEGMELLNSIFSLSLFLIVCFVIGIFFIPTFLKQFKRYLNDEALLIVSMGLCLGMVLIAERTGFSAALGAFIMGSLLAETVEAEQIERIIRPVKNLFGAIFFVSVGMLIDPVVLWEYKWPIIVLTFVVMIGQITFSILGIILSGHSLRIAFRSGFSLAQIGEFAFIIASLGLSLKVIDANLYPIVVAVSVITTFFTPYMIRLAEPAYNFVNNLIPPRLQYFMSRYALRRQTIKQTSTWHDLLKSLLRIVATYASLSLVLILLWLHFIVSYITEFMTGFKGELLAVVGILLIISPMLRAIMMKKNHSEEYKRLWNDRKFNRGPLISLIVLRILLCIGLVMIPVHSILNTTSATMFLIAGVVIALIIYSKQLKRHSILMERRFFMNLTAREKEIERKAIVNERFVNHLLEQDMHLTDTEVHPDSPVVGMMLKELNLRTLCNVNIVTIIRGSKRINIPGGEERLFPYDKLVIVGTDADIDAFNTYLEERHKQIELSSEPVSNNGMNIEQFAIAKGSGLVGLSIKQSGIRDKASCLVIGVERGNASLKNPPPTTVFEEGDIVWIVGEHKKVIQLSEGNPILFSE